MQEIKGRFDFRDLFVLDMANNHQGSTEHGTAIIEQCADAVDRAGVRAAMKFQFRDLDTFIHPAHLAQSPNKHVSRFLSTRLSSADYERLAVRAKARRLVTMCTPFDEPSVDRIVEMAMDIIKIASCSANDWPLLEKATAAGLPMIVSTGGLTLDQVDDLVSFLSHRGADFALMHCVSIYPTPDVACNLSNIASFKARYPGRVIGWSTHENPSEMVQVGIAAALGAEMFERHVGVANETIKLNAYSATPAQLDAWFAAWKRARTLMGSPVRAATLPEEREAIEGLRRGVYARRAVDVGARLQRDDVYFAFPCAAGALASGEWCDGIVATGAVAPDAPILKAAVVEPADPDAAVLKSAVHEVKGLLNLARVPLTTDFTVEYSHHYGVRNFRKIGAVLINVINREYCKKVLVTLPGQLHPWHYHKRKEETFLVLYGKLHVEVEDRVRVLQPGDTLLVLPGIWHRFWSDEGCVFEEISTTHFPNDSVYRDDAINKLALAQRKTTVDHWGRFQISDQVYARQAPTTE